MKKPTPKPPHVPSPINPKIEVTTPTAEQVRQLATLVVTARDLEQDRYGGKCGVDIYATRIGTHCVLISHYPDIGDPDSPEQTHIERLVPLKDSLRQALEIFRGQYASLTPRFRVKSAFHLTDKIVELGALIDGHYQATKDVDATLPSSILAAIAPSESAECPDKWIYFDATLYLTVSVFKRTSYLNGTEFWDESLALLFGGLKFKIRKVKLRFSKARLEFRALVERSLKIERGEDLEHELFVAKLELEELTETSNALTQKIQKLEAELAALWL